MVHVKLLDLVYSLSEALDLISPAVVGHHKKVGAVAAAIGVQLQLSEGAVTDLALAGMLHDIGAFTLQCRLDALEFDTDNVEHAEIGYRLLVQNRFLTKAAELVLYHHTPWRTQEAKCTGMECVYYLGNILNIADRVDVLIRPDEPLEEQVPQIVRRITEGRGRLFAPAIVDAFAEVAKDRSFWANLIEPPDHVRDMLPFDLQDREIRDSELLSFANSFSRLIDFRSRFTATHSKGVAESAVLLATLAGMNEDELERMSLAAHLHDIGKLAIPGEILEKPAALTDEEFETVKRHPRICAMIVGSVPGLEDVARWASQHHERLNGTGYPNHLKGDELSLGSRVMAVADVFTAIAEDRPYRAGMTREQTLRVLEDMALSGYLDKKLVGLLKVNFENIDSVRRKAQAQALTEFEAFANPVCFMK